MPPRSESRSAYWLGSARLEEARPEPKREATKHVEDGDADERELDRRADGGERWSEAATVAGEREQQSDVFTRVKRRSSEGEERDDDANGREAAPAALSCDVADREAREREEQTVGEQVAVVEYERKVRGASARRSPFGHDLRRARAATGELKADDPRPNRNVLRVDQFEDHRERNGRNAQQDQCRL